MTDSRFRLAAITLDETSVVTRKPQIESERQIAIHDLLLGNYFRPAGSVGGPYNLVLRASPTRLVFDIRLAEGDIPHANLMLPLSSMTDTIREYFLVVEKHFKAIRTATPYEIEALDMGRKALHDEAGRLLQKRLDGRLEMDFPTARRLFTLVCFLQTRG